MLASAEMGGIAGIRGRLDINDGRRWSWQEFRKFNNSLLFGKLLINQAETGPTVLENSNTIPNTKIYKNL